MCSQPHSNLQDGDGWHGLPHGLRFHDGFHGQLWWQDQQRGNQKDTQAAQLANFLYILDASARHSQASTATDIPTRKLKVAVIFIDEDGRHGSLSQGCNFAVALRALGADPLVDRDHDGHVLPFLWPSESKSHCKDCERPYKFHLQDKKGTFATGPQHQAFSFAQQKTMAAANMAFGLWVSGRPYCLTYIKFLDRQWPHVPRRIVDDFVYYTCKRATDDIISDGRFTQQRFKTSVAMAVAVFEIPLAPATEAALQEVSSALQAEADQQLVPADDVATGLSLEVLLCQPTPFRLATHYRILKLVRYSLPLDLAIWNNLLADILSDIHDIHNAVFEGCPAGVFAELGNQNMSTQPLSSLAGAWKDSAENSSFGYEDFGNACGSVLVWTLLHASSLIPGLMKYQGDALISLLSPWFHKTIIADPSVPSQSSATNAHCRRTNLLEAMVVLCNWAFFRVVGFCAVFI